MRRAKRRDWTLGELDREQGWYLWWNESESRWSVERASVFVMTDGEAVLQLEQSGSPEPPIPGAAK